MNDYRNSGTVKTCNAKCSKNFEKIVELKNSGLDIYVHGRNYLKAKESADKLRNENVIIHNTSERNLKRFDFVRELCGYKKCSHCKSLLQRVRGLLNEIKEIKADDVLGICKHCRKANIRSKCKKCEYIVKEFRKNKAHEYEDKHARMKTWISKLKSLLESSFKDKSTCEVQNLSEGSLQELQSLVKHLDNPLFVREPQFSSFLHSVEQLTSTENISECNEAIQKIITNLNTQSFVKKLRSDDSLFVTTSSDGPDCICKYFMGKEGKTSIDILVKEGEPSSASRPTRDELKSKTISNIIKTKIDKTSKKGKENISPKRKLKPAKTKDLQKEEYYKKPIIDSADMLLLKMMKDREKDKQHKEKPIKEQKMTQLPSFGKLPTIKVKEKLEESNLSSDKSLKCGDFEVQKSKEMIRGCNIAPFSNEVRDKSLTPILFKTQIDCNDSLKTLNPLLDTEIEDNNTKIDMNIVGYDDTVQALTGVVKYQLSNKEFIDKGWTKLPTTKVMRKINIYKMLPANSENWFVKNKMKKLMYYKSGEILAEIDDSGRGKWFYKNGNVALHYYEAREKLADQRYIIYGSGETTTGKSNIVNVLAAFDYLGNGVVYDDVGNARLKYNQFEGMVYDSKIAPISRWKWHDLNDPPIYETVFIDTIETNNNSIFPDVGKEVDSKRDSTKNPEMLEIEFQNQVKVKSDKLLQKFRPFQIRMKVFKINKQFSLRIIDQTTIYLLFRDGCVSMKLNLGMLLINNEIIDAETVDVIQVGTPYDRIPPKSQSVAEIQEMLRKVKKLRKTDNVLRNLNVMHRTIQTAI